MSDAVWCSAAAVRPGCKHNGRAVGRQGLAAGVKRRTRVHKRLKTAGRQGPNNGSAPTGIYQRAHLGCSTVNARGARRPSPHPSTRCDATCVVDFDPSVSFFLVGGGGCRTISRFQKTTLALGAKL